MLATNAGLGHRDPSAAKPLWEPEPMRCLPFVLTAALLAPSVAPAYAPAPAPAGRLYGLADAVKPAALHETIAALVGFGTRQTLSGEISPTRGIVPARAWVRSRFEALSQACGGCLSIETPQDTLTGPRVPTPTLVQDVLAIQRGSDEPDRVVIVSGHIDSRVTDILNAASDAPGANDDASGVAAVMECARVLSKHRFHATIVYAVLSGEEQGLLGGKILADFARSRGWRVEAVLNNDIVGNSHGMDGRVVRDEVRVFSEGTRADETAQIAKARRLRGGELDAPSRELSRYMSAIAGEALPGFHVRQIMRADRFSRGGDQEPMQEAGYPAVRVTEADENYTRQHQDLRTEGAIVYGDVIGGVDFGYLAKVARLDALTLAALADAPAPPSEVTVAGAVSADTTLRWSSVPGAVAYDVWWRETTDPAWSRSRRTRSDGAVLKGVNIDDFFFGVSARSADGFESPVVFPGPVGAFFGGAPGG